MDKHIQAILDAEGLDYDELLDTYAYDSIVPGVCVKCSNVTQVEPDASRNYCDDCESNTVVSFMRLEGII